MRCRGISNMIMQIFQQNIANISNGGKCLREIRAEFRVGRVLARMQPPQRPNERLQVAVVGCGRFFVVDTRELGEKTVTVVLEQLQQGGNARERRFALARLVPIGAIKKVLKNSVNAGEDTRRPSSRKTRGTLQNACKSAFQSRSSACLEAIPSWQGQMTSAAHRATRWAHASGRTMRTCCGNRVIGREKRCVC